MFVSALCWLSRVSICPSTHPQCHETAVVLAVAELDLKTARVGRRIALGGLCWVTIGQVALVARVDGGSGSHGEVGLVTTSACRGRVQLKRMAK